MKIECSICRKIKDDSKMYLVNRHTLDKEAQDNGMGWVDLYYFILCKECYKKHRIIVVEEVK